MEAWTRMFYVNLEKHFWFIWFMRGISLKIPKLVYQMVSRFWT